MVGGEKDTGRPEFIAVENYLCCPGDRAVDELDGAAVAHAAGFRLEISWLRPGRAVVVAKNPGGAAFPGGRRTEEGAEERTVIELDDGRVPVVHLGVDQGCGFRPGQAFIVGGHDVGAAAARCIDARAGEPVFVFPACFEGFAALRVCENLRGLRQAAVPVAAGEGNQPAAAAQPGGAGPADEAVVTDVFFGLVAPRADQHASAHAEAFSLGWGAGYLEFTGIRHVRASWRTPPWLYCRGGVASMFNTLRLFCRGAVSSRLRRDFRSGLGPILHCHRSIPR